MHNIHSCEWCSLELCNAEVWWLVKVCEIREWPSQVKEKGPQSQVTWAWIGKVSPSFLTTESPVAPVCVYQQLPCGSGSEPGTQGSPGHRRPWRELREQSHSGTRTSTECQFNHNDKENTELYLEIAPLTSQAFTKFFSIMPSAFIEG